MQEMISQKVRTLSPEIDPLRMGMGQTEADLEKLCPSRFRGQ